MMRRKLAVTTTFLLFSIGIFVSCQSDAPEVEPTATAVSTQQALVATETAVPATNTPITEPTATATATLTPTITPTATVTATSTAVPTPTFSLTQREPTLAEIEEFLSQSPVLFFSPHQDIEYELIPLKDYFLDTILTPYAEIFYQDVNGDREVDLILADMHPFVWSKGYILISLWNDTYYDTPLVIMDGAYYEQGLRVSFEDWTNDSLPEVIFDFKSVYGGTGFLETTWKRYVIRCQTSCIAIWWGVTGQLSTYNDTVGLITTNIEREINGSGDPSITIVNNSFYAPVRSGDGSSAGAYPVLTSTMKIYTWNGSLFEQVDEEILVPENMTTVSPILSATGGEGISAMITTEFDDSDITRPIYFCLLQVDDFVLNETFECLPDFTRIIWQDITNDGEEELVVLATSLGTQQLLAYQLNEQEATQVADVTGDIIRSDLFGVRLEDVDGDGQSEILAGRGYLTEGTNCKIYEDIYPNPTELCWWNELNLWEEVYRWDGQQFVSESEE